MNWSLYLKVEMDGPSGEDREECLEQSEHQGQNSKAENGPFSKKCHTTTAEGEEQKAKTIAQSDDQIEGPNYATSLTKGGGGVTCIYSESFWMFLTGFDTKVTGTIHGI